MRDSVSDTLLIAGTWADVDVLRSFFLGWNGEELELIKQLQTANQVYLFSASNLVLRRDYNRDEFRWSGDNGTWLISQNHQERVVDLLNGLLEANGAGHQYVEPDNSPVQIMVSKDEHYPLPSQLNED